MMGFVNRVLSCNEILRLICSDCDVTLINKESL